MEPSPEEIVRGLLAAQEVFDKSGVTPDEAATARFVVEAWDVSGFVGKAPEAELAICTVCDEADEAALAACCSGWDSDRVPESADLELVTPPQSFRFRSEEEPTQGLFDTAEAGILTRPAPTSGRWLPRRGPGFLRMHFRQEAAKR
jgi:hypothetical protein